MGLFRQLSIGIALATLLVTNVQAQTLRVATYNIQYLTADERPQRLEDIRKVIDAIDADVIALQEIKDRAALEAVFDPDVWQLVIDDDSGYRQDLAAAVRRPHRVLGSLNADDEDFLFSFEDNTWFPNRRDVLHVEIQTPGLDATTHVLVAHLKSRVGGRASNDYRRAGAAMRLVDVIETRFANERVILLGDFNDNPDDRALNILETGDPGADAQIENEPGEFMQNLTEPLLIEGFVTSSLNSLKIDGDTGRIIARDMASRQRNFDKRHTNAHTGNILFDQILTTPLMTARYIEGSVTVFEGRENIGSSDHLPVYADFDLQEKVDITPVIYAALPNPKGTDAGHERIVLHNRSTESLSLEGWWLTDKGGARLNLSGSINADELAEIRIPSNGYASVLPLNNTGDVLRLLNSTDELVHEASYSRRNVSEDEWVIFE